MIRIPYTFTTTGPLHHGSDTNAGTLQSLRRQKCVLAQPLELTSRLGEEGRREAVVQLCLGVWASIDWDNIKQRRLMGIWDEFAGKLNAAARCPDKYTFFEAICRSWGIRSCTHPFAVRALDALESWELLDVVRNEALYVVLRMRAIKDEAKQHQDADGHVTLDIEPVTPAENPETVTRSVAQLPAISGNAIRGRLRRWAMHDWCRLAGITQIDKRVYHTLFSGGFLDSSSTYEDFDKLDSLVETCPMLGLLGAAVGDMMIEGSLRVSWAYPMCTERGSGDRSVWEYLDTIYQTRRDSSKTESEIDIGDGMFDAVDGKKDAPQQMKYEYEAFADGTPFEARLALLDMRDMPVSAFNRVLELYERHASLGGKGAVGAGDIDLEIDRSELPACSSEAYIEHVEHNAERIREFWQALKI